MGIESDRALPLPLATRSRAAADPGWRLALPLVVGSILIVLAIHWPTVESIVAIWSRSETFAHGFLIVPIVVALIWQRRREIATLTPAPDWLGFVFLACAGGAWLIAYAGEVLVVKQLAVVATICAAVVAIVGRRVALAILFPLGFLILAVPMGEALIPPLMEWTADFTVVALQVSGIPVFREGLFFSIPSGNWSIVEGCSGLRYLIASFTVGVLFAYLSYRRPLKRLLFVALSVIVPILANGMRAYLIVMIAHLSDNQLAHGVDHFIYGWVFFGLVMLLLFWIGSFWRDSDAGTVVREGLARANGAAASRATFLGCALAAMGLVAVWPAYAAYLDRNEGASGGSLVLAAPVPTHGWNAETAEVTDWRPHYDPPAASVLQAYRKAGRVVVVYLGYYRHQHRGAQLINSVNVMVVQKHPVWANVGESYLELANGSASLEVRETKLRSVRQRLLIWDWYHIAARDLTNPYVAKWLLAWRKLTNRGDDGAVVIIATPYQDQSELPATALREFAQDMGPSINAALARAQPEAGASGQ